MKLTQREKALLWFHFGKGRKGETSMKKIILKSMRLARDKTPDFWDWLMASKFGAPICNLWDWCAQ